MDGRKVKVVRSLSREDSSIAWFPLHNSLHLEMPPHVKLVHINVFSQSGMTTFFASPEDLQSHHMFWEEQGNSPRPGSGPRPIRPAGPKQAGPATMHYYPNYVYHSKNNSAQVPANQVHNYQGPNITLPTAAPNLPFQRSEQPSSRSFSHNQKKHMPVLQDHPREPYAVHNPLLSAALFNTNNSQESMVQNSTNHHTAVPEVEPNLQRSSPVDRIRTAPVTKDISCADVTPHPTIGVKHTQGPESVSEDDTCSSSGASTMSTDSPPEEGSVKVNTSTVTSSSVSSYQAGETVSSDCSPHNFKRSHNNQSEDCYIVETREQDKDSGSVHPIQKGSISSPPRKLQKGDEENEQDG